MDNSLDAEFVEACKIMGVSNDIVFDYDQLVSRYIALLNYYAYNLSDEKFLNFTNFTKINRSLNICLANVLDDYSCDDYDESNPIILVNEDENFYKIMEVANVIVERFNSNNCFVEGVIAYSYLGQIAYSLYQIETEDVKTKTYS